MDGMSEARVDAGFGNDGKYYLLYIIIPPLLLLMAGVAMAL